MSDGELTCPVCGVEAVEVPVDPALGQRSRLIMQHDSAKHLRASSGIAPAQPIAPPTRVASWVDEDEEGPHLRLVHGR